VINFELMMNFQMVFLPEAFDYIAENKEATLQLSEPLDGPLMKKYQSLANDLGIWISLGGFHERTKENKMHVAHVILDSKGDVASVYRKAHLFAFGALDESKYIVPGKIIFI
jgi:deaminated glutathione amidase